MEIQHFQELMLIVYCHLQTLFPEVKEFRFHFIKRRTERQRVLGYINLRQKVIALDIFSAKEFRLKKMSALLKILAHEIAHIQKPPYRQRYRGHLIIRQHYPEFYTQVTNNIKIMKTDQYLKAYFD
jgi:hypothetical protein